MNRYVRTPDIVSYNEVVNSQYKLSSSLFLKLVIPNANSKKLAYFLSRKLDRTDLGVEVGSLSYIDKSSKYFLRTKALQDYSYIPELNSETMLPILPKDFVNMHLKKGDVVISKDSNIGEVVILEKDYPDCMLSGALYKLPVKEEWKYYLLAFIKHDIFREQLNAIVPKGATIRHAKTLFLDCLIPLPNCNAENVVKYVSLLTEAIVNKQVLIKKRHAEILRLIEEELQNNQKPNTFEYHLPTLKDLKEVGRLDTGLYTESYWKKDTCIKNYNNGYTPFLELNKGDVDISRGQNLQESNIGKSIYDDIPHKGFYRLALSKNFTETQTIVQYQYLGNQKKLKTISMGEIIFSCRGDMGRNLVYCEPIDDIITNIDSVHIVFKNQELYKTIFVSQFLGYLRNIDFLKTIAITGSGADSFTKYQFALLKIPNFPDSKQKEIAQLYHNPIEYNTEEFTLDNFTEKDNAYNAEAGIYELDKTAKHLQELLNDAIDKIVNNQEVEIKF